MEVKGKWAENCFLSPRDENVLELDKDGGDTTLQMDQTLKCY